jgi:hypothetical protein
MPFLALIAPAYAQVPSGGGIPYPVVNGDCLIGSGGQPIWGSCSGGSAVSSVTNSDGTLTITPSSGAVVASLALGHPNTWTGNQTYNANIILGTGVLLSPADGIQIQGSGSGVSQFQSALSGSSNNTVISPGGASTNTLTYLGNGVSVTNGQLAEWSGTAGALVSETFASACTAMTNLAFGCGKVDASTVTESAGVLTVIGDDYYVANASSTGTTINKLAKLTGSPSSQAVITSHTDPPASATAIGIVTSGAGTTGTAIIQFNGVATCVFDGAAVAGHLVQMSTGTDGDCTDAGTSPGNGQVIGTVMGTIGAAGNAPVALAIVPTTDIPAPSANTLLGSSSANSPNWLSLDTNTITNSSGVFIVGSSFDWPNAGSTGTTLGKLAKFTGTPSTAVITSHTTDSTKSVAVGVVVAGAGTSGSAEVLNVGIANCAFDGATTAGHAAQVSSATDGDCTDSGSITPNAGQIVGVILGTIGAAGNAPVAFNIPSEATSPLAYLNVPSQLYTGGIHPQAYGNGTGSGTTTIDCGNGPIQTLYNNGGFTLAMSANDGSCVVRINNGPSAGTITFSGFSEGSNTGDSLNTTNNNYFDIALTRINAKPHYLISALQ